MHLAGNDKDICDVCTGPIATLLWARGFNGGGIGADRM